MVHIEKMTSEHIEECRGSYCNELSDEKTVD